MSEVYNTYLTSDFFENEDSALRNQKIVLRDSLGSLAVQILSSKYNLSQMNYEEMLDKLYVIIDELHTACQHKVGNFTS